MRIILYTEENVKKIGIMHELYMDCEMYRERVNDLEEWLVSICHSEGMDVPEEAVSKERVKEIEKKYEIRER